MQPETVEGATPEKLKKNLKVNSMIKNVLKKLVAAKLYLEEAEEELEGEFHD